MMLVLYTNSPHGCQLCGLSIPKRGTEMYFALVLVHECLFVAGLCRFQVALLAIGLQAWAITNTYGEK